MAKAQLRSSWAIRITLINETKLQSERRVSASERSVETIRATPEAAAAVAIAATANSHDSVQFRILRT